MSQSLHIHHLVVRPRVLDAKGQHGDLNQLMQCCQELLVHEAVQNHAERSLSQHMSSGACQWLYDKTK